MKNTFAFLTLGILLFCGYSVQSQTKAVTVPVKVQVIYFHATQRCPTCLAIEDNTMKTLKESFAEEMKNGTIKFESVNVDEKENYKLAEKYEAGGSALWLTQYNKGKEVKKDMTNFAFSYGRSNPDKFIAGLKDEITKLLK